MYGKGKSDKVNGMAYECNPMSIKMCSVNLSSSNDTVNPMSFVKSGKAIVKGK